MALRHKQHHNSASRNKSTRSTRFDFVYAASSRYSLRKRGYALDFRSSLPRQRQGDIKRELHECARIARVFLGMRFAQKFFKNQIQIFQID